MTERIPFSPMIYDFDGKLDINGYCKLVDDTIRFAQTIDFFDPLLFVEFFKKDKRWQQILHDHEMVNRLNERIDNLNIDLCIGYENETYKQYKEREKITDFEISQLQEIKNGEEE